MHKNVLTVGAVIAALMLATIGGSPAIGRGAGRPLAAPKDEHTSIPVRRDCNQGPPLELRPHTVETGTSFDASGYLAPAGRLVKYQQLIGGDWVTIGHTRTPEQCWFSKFFVSSCRAGTYFYRVVAPSIRRNGNLYPAVTTKREVLTVNATPVSTIKGLLRITNTSADGLEVTAMSNDGRLVSYTSGSDPLCRDVRGADARTGTFVYDEDSTKTTHIADAEGGVLSGDGSVVAVITKKRLTADDQNRTSDLYLAASATGAVRRVATLSDCPVERYSPIVGVSADGSRVLYKCTYESRGGTRLVDTTTGSDRYLFRSESQAMSLDGKKIAYVDDYSRSQGGGYVTVLDVSDPDHDVTERLTEERVDVDAFDMSEDGNIVMYLTYGRYIHIFDRARGEIVRNFDAKPRIYDTSTLGLSGDGQTVWYTSDLSFEMRNWATREKRRIPLKYGSQRPGSIAASSDASEVAFTSGMEPPNLRENVYLWTPQT